MITDPETALVTLDVLDEDIPEVSSEFIAFASMSLSCTRPGLRVVALFDQFGHRSGDFSYASLMVRVQIDPVGDGDLAKA